MSYRTVAQMDMDRPDVIMDLRDRNRLHKRLMSLYPDGLGDNPRRAINLIFAADPNTGQLTIQSDLRPVVGPLNDSRNGYFSKVITKPTQEVGMQFNDQDTVSFKLYFAAQQRCTNEGKRVPIQDDDAVIAKATAALARVGLNVSSMMIDGWDDIRSARRGVAYKNAQLVGIGVVSNASLLREAVIAGVGSGRLWGSGVLLIGQP